MENAKKINTSFIKRKYYWGRDKKSKNNKEALRHDFFNNIISTDYTVCVRGTGNFSARLYETLALGKIPIFFNTDSVLPFNEKIDWNDHMVVIPQKI